MILRKNTEWVVLGLFPFGPATYLPSVRMIARRNASATPLSGAPLRKPEALRMIADHARLLSAGHGFEPVTDLAMIREVFGETDPYVGMEIPITLGPIGKYLEEIREAQAVATRAAIEAEKAKSENVKAEAERKTIETRAVAEGYRSRMERMERERREREAGREPGRVNLPMSADARAALPPEPTPSKPVVEDTRSTTEIRASMLELD